MINPICIPNYGQYFSTIPSAFDDSFSYYETLTKLAGKVNEIIATTNELPEYIQALVAQELTSDKILDVFNSLLTSLFLNVKAPPLGITPAKGDGTEDDTASLQGCIDYAKTHNMFVYIPSGTYLVNSLTIPQNVSIVGLSKENTKLVLKGGATLPLLTCQGKNSVTGLELNGNYGVQVSQLNLIALTGDNTFINDVILDEGITLIEGVINSKTIISNVNFRKATTCHLRLTGGGNAIVQNCFFDSLTPATAECCISIGVSNSEFDNIFCNASCPIGIKVIGNNNTVKANVTDATKEVEITGANNTILIHGKLYDVTSNSVVLNGDKVIVKTTEFEVDSVNPLTYRTPTKINERFSYVPFKDKLGTDYKMLVGEGDVTSTYVNVRDYGAKGDNIADDTLAFQNALATGHGVFVPIGNYKITGALTLTKQVMIGESKEASKLLTSQTITLNTMSSLQSLQIITTASVGVYSAHYANLVFNCYMIGDVTKSTIYKSDSGNYIMSCEIGRFLVGIELTGGDNSQTVFDCIINNQHGNQGIGTCILLKDVTAPRISDCDLLWANYGIRCVSTGLDLFSIQIEHCFIDNNNIGVELGYKDNTYVRRSNIVNCWINAKKQGIIVYKSNGLSIDKCEFMGDFTDYAIGVDSLTNGTITNCKFQGSTKCIQLIACDGVTIKNNYFTPWSENDQPNTQGIVLNRVITGKLNIIGNDFTGTEGITGQKVFNTIILENNIGCNVHDTLVWDIALQIGSNDIANSLYKKPTGVIVYADDNTAKTNVLIKTSTDSIIKVYSDKATNGRIYATTLSH